MINRSENKKSSEKMDDQIFPRGRPSRNDIDMGLSTSIAVIPILTTLEDFFVNGVKYADELEVFIGTPNKHTVTSVLETYYGRMKDTTLSWGRINQMVEKMYSHDFQYPDYTKNISTVDFYGNDGVCLFKYFVKNTDP